MPRSLNKVRIDRVTREFIALHAIAPDKDQSNRGQARRFFARAAALGRTVVRLVRRRTSL